MTETTPTLTDEQRDLLLAPCVCGHTINDHGGYVACWRCEDEGDECDTPFEAILAERIARMVADAEQRGRAEALREFARKWADWTARDAPQIRGGAAYRAVCEAQALESADEVTP